MVEDTVEAVSSRNKREKQYALIKEYQEYLQDIENLEVEDIILNVCAKDREIQFGRKVSYLNSRALMHDALEKASGQKVSIHKETHGVYVQTAEMTCHAAATMFGNGFSAVAQAFQATHRHSEKNAESRVAVLDHSYQRMRDIAGDYSQQGQAADRQHEQSNTTIDRMMQAKERLSQMIAGG